MRKLKCFLQTNTQSCSASTAILLIRFVMGVAFLYHGWGKIQTPMSWMPPDSPVPGFFQLLAAVSEFGGGIALILGLLTRLASLGLAFTMAVATYMHAVIMGDPFVAMGPGSAFELPLLYLILSINFILVGAGKFSLDAKIFGEHGGC